MTSTSFDRFGLLLLSLVVARRSAVSFTTTPPASTRNGAAIPPRPRPATGGARGEEHSEEYDPIRITGTQMQRRRQQGRSLTSQKQKDRPADGRESAPDDESGIGNDDDNNAGSTIHFCFIVHGHQGRPTDLSYLHHAVKAQAFEAGGGRGEDRNGRPHSSGGGGSKGRRRPFRTVKSSDSCVVGRGSGPCDAPSPSPSTAAPAASASTAASGRSTARRTNVRARRGKRHRFPVSWRRRNNDASEERDALHGDGGNYNPRPSEEGVTDPTSADNDEATTSENGGPVSDDEEGGVLVVRNAACNEGRTHDGIVNGGTRLAREMLEVIGAEVRTRRKHRRCRQHSEEAIDAVDVTLSMIGNSLGGLYARYAAMHLWEALGGRGDEHRKEGGSAAPSSRRDAFLVHRLEDDGDAETATTAASGKVDVRVRFNVLCTIASPHLGCADHTYIPIPRTAERAVARAIGETGADLFRLNDLMHDMATSPRFLAPLASFRKRVAYANAYHTDFPVPGSTAAFLDGDSDSPHYFDERFGEDKGGGGRGRPAWEGGSIAAVLHTPRRAPTSNDDSKGAEGALTSMSRSLDSLGWKKVFVDMRKELPGPSLSIPFFNSNRRRRPFERWKADDRGAARPVPSRDLERAVSSWGGSLPLGHNAICAFSRGPWSAAINAGGRPVMDGLAAELTREMLACE